MNFQNADADQPKADLPKSHTQNFAVSILNGLQKKQKTIESKWFYDARGSKLFEDITQLDEYYPTRTETRILKANAAALSGLFPKQGALVELGSGSSTKTRILLDAFHTLSTYVPIDISSTYLRETANRLHDDYPDIEVRPVVADFTKDIVLPATLMAQDKVLFFPGSTIGNFEPDDAATLLSRLRNIQNVKSFIIGFDLVKNIETLINAYDDADGVTAAFNLNLLTRINQELKADIAIDAFNHQACWNAEKKRIEMHLLSRWQQEIVILGERFSFQAGETIHTENSHKYTQHSFEALAEACGWKMKQVYMDEQKHFAIAVLV